MQEKGSSWAAVLGRSVSCSLLAAAFVAVFTGCSASPKTASSESPAGRVSLPTCPNPDGGGCLGPLTPDVRYHTSAFVPAISFEVPEKGWVHEEDLQGNFLLLPPGNTLPGVNAATSDFIGVYASVAPERFRRLPSCTTETDVTAGDTPQAFSDWLQGRADVSVADPTAVTIGGLHGLRVDIALTTPDAAPECTDDGTGTSVRYLPILKGEGTADLDHGLVPDLTMRLYLLSYKQGVLAIEVDDIAAAPGSLTSLSRVAEGFRFADE